MRLKTINAGAKPAAVVFSTTGTHTVNVKAIDNSGLSSTAAVCRLPSIGDYFA